MNKYPRMQLTPNFWLHEACASGVAERRGIDNDPPIEMIPVLCNTSHGMERIRACVGGRPVVVSSWYRSPAVNSAVGGAATSQHVRGEAVDFRVVGMSVVDSARALAADRDALGFDQLILEYPQRQSPWVHVSFAFGRGQRGQILHIEQAGQYINGLGRWAD